MAALTIGQVAKLAGVHVETVRYYQRIGLVPTPPKPMQGFRRYDDQTIVRIRFIKNAQKMGFSLKEIARLLSLAGDSCGEVRRLLEEKKADVAAKVEQLERLRGILEQSMALCERDSGAGCRLLEKLMSESS